jgi:hypothetical protein
MWTPSGSSRAVASGGFILIFSLAGAAEPDVRLDSLVRYRTNASAHGLYEIREAARAFLAREGAKKKIDYKPMDPSMQIVVPRCLVPLTVRWARKSLYHDGPGVDVLCKRSIEKKHDHSWDVFVPMLQPEIVEKWRLLEEKNKRDAAAASAAK